MSPAFTHAGDWLKVVLSLDLLAGPLPDGLDAAQYAVFAPQKELPELIHCTASHPDDVFLAN